MPENSNPPNSRDLERSYNLGQEHESDDRAPIARAWHTMGMSEAEMEAYEKGEQNARENRDKSDE